MLYVKIENGKAVSASAEYPGDLNHYRGYENRNDWRSFERAEQVADELNFAIKGSQETGKYIAVDSGEHVSPRFDVIVRPQVGDEVSYSFNGDTYPDGKITAISSTYKMIRTDTGSAYYRRKLTGCWKKKGGTWSLVLGHRNERNPSF